MNATPSPLPGRGGVLTSGEVAVMFRVDSRTVTRWDREGRFPEGAVFRTPGGHRRYREPAVRAMIARSAR